MNNIKKLSIYVIILILVNVGLLLYILFFKHHHRKKPREIVIEKLHFNNNQIKKYDITIKKHQKNIREIDDSIKMVKNKLYILLNQSKINKEQQDSLIQKITFFQKKTEIIHFNHFLEIKEICHKDQLDEFKDLTTELSKIFSHGKKPKP
jgi:protein CpxP